MFLVFVGKMSPLLFGSILGLFKASAAIIIKDWIFNVL